MGRPIKEQKGKKQKKVEVRVTIDEYNLLKEKSKGYQSLSSFLLDAAKNHDERRGRNRIDTMIRFSELMSESDTSIARIGNNVNQIAKAIHRQNMEGIDLKNTPLGHFSGLIEEAKNTLKEILIELRKISNSTQR